MVIYLDNFEKVQGDFSVLKNAAIKFSQQYAPLNKLIIDCSENSIKVMLVEKSNYKVISSVNLMRANVSDSYYDKYYKENTSKIINSLLSIFKRSLC